MTVIFTSASPTRLPRRLLVTNLTARCRPPVALLSTSRPWRALRSGTARVAGTRTALGVGRAKSVHESTNLAEVRLRAARLGTNEVHVLPAS
jgi:hypothetical protein